MFVAALIFAATLTRAEIIERMRAPVLTKVQGLVQVIAECPSDMRREYQASVAGFAATICNELYRGYREQPRRFTASPLTIVIGEERTNNAAVVTHIEKVKDEVPRTRLYLPAPGFTNLEKLQAEVIKAFMRSVKGKELTDAEAVEFYTNLDPARRAANEEKELEKWKRGEKTSLSDEEALTLMRKVLLPGMASVNDVLTFASRLRLYALTFDTPYLGKYAYVTYAEAIDIADIDPRVRFAAFNRAPLLVAYSGGRSEELAAAGKAYSDFLFALARFTDTKEELHKQLEEADLKLNIALEKARNAQKGSEP